MFLSLCILNYLIYFSIIQIYKKESTHYNVRYYTKGERKKELINHDNGTCPIEYTLEVMGGKWKLLIIYYLMTNKIMRYGELKRNITGITHKMLSSQLKDLESHGIITRKEYPQVPPKVEYALSKKVQVCCLYLV